MINIYVVVEGYTEERFIKDFFPLFFRDKNFYFQPIVLETSRTPQKKYKGGLNKYSQLKRDILRLLKQTHVSLVTTMIDYYNLPQDFPGKTTLPSGDIYRKVAFLEEEFFKDINHEKFMPYIQIHEFETLLFVDKIGFEVCYKNNKKVLNKIVQIFNQYPNPEEINDSPTGHPSARIEQIDDSFSKTLHGLEILKIIFKEKGPEIFLQKCKHFSEWINKIKKRFIT